MAEKVCCNSCGFYECNCPDKNPESDYNRMAKPIVVTHPCPDCTKLQAENAEYRRCLEILLGYHRESPTYLPQEIRRAIGLEYLERFGGQIRARDAVIKAARELFPCGKKVGADYCESCVCNTLCRVVQNLERGGD